MNDGQVDPGEQLRLGSLRDLGILDSPAEAAFDALVEAASLVCGTPISLISLVDETRQWFKANIGLPGVSETPREHAFCAHAILGDDVMEVPDATHDERFAANPLVTGAPDIKFYAGVPIRIRNGQAVGTLCVIDRQARRMDARQLAILRSLGRAAGYGIEDWRARRDQTVAAQALRDSEASLQNTLQRLSLATESCNIGIWDWDIAADRLRWDGRMFRLYGLEPVPGEYSFDLWQRHVHKQDLARALQAVAAAIHAEKSTTLEFRIVWPDGSVREIAGTARVTRDAQGRALHMVGTNWDVTEQRAADALRAARDLADRASRAKSEFLATMSHEIRSPLSGLIGVVDLLHASGLNNAQAGMVRMVQRSAGMLLAVLNDILDFSKIEAGAMTASPVPVQLRGLIKELEQPLRIAAKQKHLAFTVAIGSDLPEWILLDGLRLRQILTNLLANAIKFTEAGGVRLDIHATATDELGLDVTDTGMGMSEVVLAQLFTPFMQADGSTSRRFGGTGLGLSISHKLAALLGGDLTAASRPGEGSVFSLRLKLVPCPPPVEAVRQHDGAAMVTVPASCRVLLVDDDPTIRWLLEQQMLKMGLRPDVAEDGAAALRMLQTGRYDVLLTDCHMPGLDGVGLSKAVRSAGDDWLARMPILGLTADVTEVQRRRCLEAGMNDLANKPVTIERLAQLLHRHVHHSAAQAVAAPDPPALRQIAFDDQIFLSIFTPGDAKGAEWLGEYLDSARADHQRLATLLAEAEPCRRDLAFLAHRLAGASFSVGAMRLGAAARDLEHDAAEAPLVALRAQCDAASLELEEAARAMAHLLR